VLLQPFISEESIYQLPEITDPSELKKGVSLGKIEINFEALGEVFAQVNSIDKL